MKNQSKFTVALFVFASFISISLNVTKAMAKKETASKKGYTEKILKGAEASELFRSLGQNYFTKKHGNKIDIYRVIRSPDGLHQTVCEEEQNAKKPNAPSHFECKIQESVNGEPIPVVKDGPVYSG